MGRRYTSFDELDEAPEKDSKHRLKRLLQKISKKIIKIAFSFRRLVYL